MKSLFAGVAIAAMTGLLLGGAMRPNLAGDERPAGPQMFAGWSGVRSTGPFDPGKSFSGYQGPLPDYVVGTDWKSAAVALGDEVEYQPAEPPNYYANARAEPVEYARNSSEEPARAEPIYPSMSGGVRYDASTQAPHADAPQQKAPPAANIDDEAPPEATGDTSPTQG